MVSLTRLLRLQLHNLDSVCQLTDPRRQRFRRDILTAPGNRIVGDGGGGNAGGSLRISLLAERLGTTDPAPACVVLEAIKLLCLYVNNEEIDESIRLLCLDSLEKVLLNDIREEQLFIEIARCCMVSEVSLGVNRRKVQLIKILISNPTMSTHIPSDILWGYFKLCHYELIQSNDVEAELVIKTLYHLIFSQTLRSQTLRGSKSDDSHQDPPVAWESLRLQFVKYVIRLLNTGLKLNKQRLPSYPCRPVGELPWLQQQTAGDDLHSIDHCERSGLLEQPKANSVVEAGTTAGAGLLTDNSGLNASLSSNPSSVLSSSNWSAEPAPPTDLKAPAGRTSMTDARNAAANIGTDSRLLEGPIGKRVSDVSRGSRIDSADSKLELLQEVDERLVKGREEQLINLGYQLLYDSITVGPEHFKSDGPLKDLLNRYVIPVVWQTQNSVDVSAYVFATQLRFLIPLLTDLNNPVHYQMFINTFAVRNVLLQGLTGGDTSVGTYLNGQHPSTYLTKSVNLLERQEMVCKMILQIFGTIGPQGILSIFENFDCNFQRTPILRRIVIAAIVNAEPEFTPKEIRDPKDASASRSQADSPVIEDAQPQHYTTRVWKSLAIQQGGRGAGGRVRSSYKRVCAVQKAGFDILCKIAECVSLILSQWESERQSSATAPRENAPSPGSVQLVPLSACLSSAAKNLVERRRTEELVHAINQAGPKEISEHLIRAGKIRDEDDVTAVARFLLLTPSLNLSLIGEVLGSKGPWHQQVLDAFLRLFDFNGVSAVSALRMFLGSFKLPGEGQMIDRILDRFGKEYFLQQDIAPGQSITPPSTDPNDPVLTVEERTPRLVVNENGSGRTVFVTSDVVFLLSFAIVMLNTDLHHPDAKTKMSVDNFLANTYRIEDMTTLSALYMRSVYQTIKEDGLAINKQIEEDGLYPTEHPVIDVHTLLQQSELTHAAWEMKDEAVVLELAETLWTEGEFWNTAYIQVMSNCKDFVYFEKGLECFYHLISIWSRFGKADYILAMLADMMQFIHPVCSYKTQATLPYLLESFRRSAGLLHRDEQFLNMIVELNDLISLCGMAPRLSATRFMREDFQDHHSWLLREVFRLLPREGPPPQDEGNRERNKDLRYYEMIEKVSKNAGGWFGGLTGMLFASRTDVPVDEDVVVGALSGNSPNVTMVLSSDGGAGDSGRSVLSEHKEALESARACWRRWIRISDVTLKKSMAQTAACWFENALAVMTGGNVLRYTLADADDESDTIVLALTNLLEAPTIRWASARSSLNSSQHRFNMRRDYAPILTWISTDMQHARILRPDSYLLDCLELAVAVRSSLVRVSQLLVLVEQRVWTALPYMNQLYQTFETQVTQSHSLGCQPNSVSASSAPPRPGTKLQVFPPATFVAHLLQVISELLRSPELLGASVPSSLASSALVAYEHEPPLDSALAADGQAPPLSGHAPPLSGQAPPMGTPAQTLKPQDLVPLCDTESTVCDPGVRTLSSKDVAARLTCLMFAVCSLSQEALSCGVTFALDDLVALIETPSFWSVDFADLGFDRRAGPVPAVPIIVMLYVHRMSPMAVNKALSAVRDDAVSRAVVEVTARANCALLQAFQAHAFVELLGQLLNHPQIVPPDPAEAAILEEDPGSVGGNAGDEGNRVPDETGIAYSGATTDPQARSSTVAETGAKSSSPEGSELDEAVAKQPQSGESRGGPQKRAGKTARRWLSVHRRKGQTEGVTPRMSVITNVTWPAVFVRLYVQCYMYATWRMWPLFCERLPNPPTSLFEPEEHAASLSGGDMRRGNVTGGSGLGGSSGGGGTDVFEEGTLLVPRLVKETYGRIAKMGVRIDGLMELWRSIAQLLSVMTAFGTRKERRVAMQAMSSHLGLVPCRGLESWYEIIELQLIPELSLNYVEVYPCCSYPIPLRKLGPPEPRNIPEVLGKTLLQLVSCHYEPIPIPFSSYLADLFVKAREYLVKNKLLGPRNNQVIGDLKRHILNVMEELNEPLQSIRLVDFTPPTKAVPSKAAKESAGKDGESAVNEAISEQNPERDPERVVHGLIPVVCRLLRICLHEIAVQERADANPEAILETLKTLLVVLASTPDIAKVDEVEGAVILKSLRQLPDGALVPKGQHRNAAKNPEDLSALDPRIRPTFECIQYILLLADMRTTIKSILEIIH